MSIYLPRTQLTSIFEGQPIKTRPFPSKTRVIWVLGVYIYIYIRGNNFLIESCFVRGMISSCPDFFCACFLIPRRGIKPPADYRVSDAPKKFGLTRVLRKNGNIMPYFC